MGRVSVGLMSNSRRLRRLDGGEEVDGEFIVATERMVLFRSARGRTGEMTNLAMHRVDAWRMIRRRAKAAGLDAEICCHTFRATGITADLDNNGTSKNIQAMAAHESPRTTKLYDRTSDEIALDEVEPIVI